MSDLRNTTIYLPQKLRQDLTDWNTNHPEDAINISKVCREKIEEELEKKQNQKTK